MQDADEDVLSGDEDERKMMKATVMKRAKSNAPKMEASQGEENQEISMQQPLRTCLVQIGSSTVHEQTVNIRG